VQCLKLLQDYESKVEQRLFHVAFARLMELTNVIQKTPLLPQMHTVLFSHLLVALFPFAPHLTSELFQELWQEDLSRYRMSVSYSELLEKLESKVPFRVQINGRFVCVVDLNKSCIGHSNDILGSLQQVKHPKLTRLDGMQHSQFRRCIAIPDKPVVNFIL
jgi:leucyl-tRNA synthetase